MTEILVQLSAAEGRLASLAVSKGAVYGRADPEPELVEAALSAFDWAHECSRQRAELEFMLEVEVARVLAETVSGLIEWAADSGRSELRREVNGTWRRIERQLICQGVLVT